MRKNGCYGDVHVGGDDRDMWLLFIGYIGYILDVLQQLFSTLFSGLYFIRDGNVYMFLFFTHYAKQEIWPVA